MSAKDKDQEPGTFMIQACRCRRCGGLLTSKEGVRNGIGHVCRMKALREMPDPNQVTVFDVLGDKSRRHPWRYSRKRRRFGRRHFAARHNVCDSFSGREEMSAKDKDQEPGTFMIQACRCRRCGGLLTSKEGVRNGIGHVCRMKALREMPDPNQVTVFDVLGDKEENTHEK